MTSPARTVTKAVIPVAGRGLRHFPASSILPKELFPLVCPDGVTRPAIHLIIQSAVEAGIDQVALIVSPDQQAVFQNYFRPTPDYLLHALPAHLQPEASAIAQLASHIHYIIQPSPEGFGHAVWCARDFIGHAPFLLMLGDHIHLPASTTQVSPVKQVMQAYASFGGVSMTAVHPVHADSLHLYGVAAGQSVPNTPRNLFTATDFLEKPDPATAAARLHTPNLPPDHFLAMAGLYIFTPSVVTSLDRLIADNSRLRGEFQLASAQQDLIANNTDYHLLLIDGLSLDIGTPLGYTQTQASLLQKHPHSR